MQRRNEAGFKPGLKWRALRPRSRECEGRFPGFVQKTERVHRLSGWLWHNDPTGRIAPRFVKEENRRNDARFTWVLPMVLRARILRFGPWTPAATAQPTGQPGDLQERPLCGSSIAAVRRYTLYPFPRISS